MRHCPVCKHVRAWRLGDGRLKCRRCGRRYVWTTAWAGVRISAASKRRLLELFVLGVPVYRQRFRSEVSAPTAERFYRIVRACCAMAEELREPFAGAIECDETMFGGARPGKRGWGAAGKLIVFGLVKRNGEVKAVAIDARSRAAVMRQIQAHSREGSLYYTDDWQAYATLKLRGEHVRIRKEKGKPVGREHINGIEGFWSYAKNWLYPFRGVPRKHFHLYLGEICFRFNHRSEDLYPLLYKLLRTTNFNDLDPKLVRNR
jgi:transposase